MRCQHAVLVEQCQLPVAFEHPLDHEHDVRTAGIELIEDQRSRALERPGENALLEFGDLMAVADHDGVTSDEVHAGDVAVEVDADCWPVEPRRNLLDVCGLAGAVGTLHQDASILCEACEDRQRDVGIESVGRIDFGDVFVAFGKPEHLEVAGEPEDGFDVDRLSWLFDHGADRTEVSVGV